MNKEKKELENLSQSFATEIAKLEKLMVASPDASPSNDMESCMRAIYSVANNLNQRINTIYSSMYAYQDNHEKGHLPPCPSSEHMDKAIKSLGWDKNYQVQKKTIFASRDLFVIKSK